MEIRNNQHQIKVLKVNIQRKRRRKHLYLLYFIFLSSLDIMCQGNADTNQLLKGCCQAHCVPSEWAPPAKSCPLHVGHRRITNQQPSATKAGEQQLSQTLTRGQSVCGQRSHSFLLTLTLQSSGAQSAAGRRTALGPSPAHQPARSAPT